MITIHKARKRVLTFSLIAFCAFWLTPSFSEVGPIFFLLWFATFMMLFGSQVFWIGRVLDSAERSIPGPGAFGSVSPPQFSTSASSLRTTPLLSKCFLRVT